jgi:hypothetical protein
MIAIQLNILNSERPVRLAKGKILDGCFTPRKQGFANPVSRSDNRTALGVSLQVEC